MATMAKSSGTMPIDDPFVSSHPPEVQRQRYSGFDSQQFSLNANGSPSQIKRALEAHLAETDRRLQDASQIGSVLVKQRQELAERLRDVDDATNGDEIPLELRQKVAELEKEVAEISRETARIFVPKTRIPSGESAADAGTSVLSSHAQHSPSKVHAPVSRKARNQPQTRLNDVKLATALTDTLLNQMRDLQAAYAEREEALKLANLHNSELEVDLETLRQKMKALDDSEQRFKDENWSLETQVSDLLTAQKEASDREQRLTLTVNSSRSQHESVQREFEELKQTHSKLAEEHSVVRKQHDSELGALRRNATTSEAEVGSLRKKIDDLTSQNKELAKAFAARIREGERAASQEYAFAQASAEDDQVTPENSPPPSPSKATPRHGALESETIKSSLHHAQRMIQHLKNNIHREKTEKFELKKLLQEARDELDTMRKGGDSANKGKRNSKQVEALKKQIRPDRLGAARNSKDEIFMADPEWEDNDMPDTPSKAPNTHHGDSSTSSKGPVIRMPGAYADTATEASDAFETANENNTETEAFQTGVETLDGDSDSDQLTETEQVTPRDSTRPKSNALNRYSFHSTASTSDDEDASFTFQTPLHKSQVRSKTRVGSSHAKSSPPGVAERSFTSEGQSPLQDSPASFADSSGTPVQGKSLFAELDDLSDGETEASGTPQSMGGSSRFSTPQLGRKSSILPSRLRAMESYEGKPAMSDMGTMTDDHPSEEPKSSHSLVTGAGLGIMGALMGAGITEAVHSKTEEPKSVEVHVAKLVSSAVMSQTTEPHAVEKPSVKAPSYTTSTISYQQTAPISPPAVAPKVVRFTPSTIFSQETQPVSAPIVTPIPAPIPIPVVIPTEPTKAIFFKTSGVISQSTEPLTPQSSLERTPIISCETSPVITEVKKSVPFARPVIVSQHSEPLVRTINSPKLESASIRSVDTKPVESIPAPMAVPVIEPVKVFSMADQSTETEPFVEPTFDFSSVISQDITPMPVSKSIETIGFPSITKKHSASSIITQETEPVTPKASKSRGLVEQEAVAAVGVAASIAAGGIAGSVFKRNKDRNEPIVIAEDETSQTLKEPTIADATTQGDRMPFQAVDGNAQTTKASAERLVPDSSRAVTAPGLNESTQTMLSSTDIENLFKAKAGKDTPTASIPPPVVISSNPSPKRVREPTTRRPGSAGSNRSGMSPPPPLPAEAKQVIAAQRASMQPSTAGATGPGAMGPPIMPASAYKRASTTNRPTTPVLSRTVTKTTVNAGTVNRSGMSSPVTTRRSSVTSFASELDQRFNIAGGQGGAFDGYSTDPRMLRALTETMLGEWMWKYTSGSGSDGASNNRHQRFFWVHPYTLTLYWSTERPQESNKKKGKASAVSINSVRSVQDDNPNPPGLHDKSILIETPHRTIKMTAPTAQRHETWFNALTYLLMRQNGPENDYDEITADDIADFDPNIRSSSRTTNRSRATVSTYASQSSRTQHPTLRPPPHQGSQLRSQSAQPSSISSRLSAVFRTPQSFRGSRSSRYSQAASSVANSTGATPAETPTVTTRNSAEDMRRTIEAQEREAHRMENVRACCDGIFIPHFFILPLSYLFIGRRLI
jgi:predicted  nucleic acid-binding Zn-ribbon protein